MQNAESAFKQCLTPTLTQELGCCERQLVIPFLPEPADKWLAEKLIGTHSLGASHHLGSLAYFPTMIVNCSKAVILFQTHRIKSTTDGLEEISLTLASRFLKRTEAYPSGTKSGKHAIGAIHKLRHKVALFIHITHSFPLYNTSGILVEIWQYSGQKTLQ